MTDNERRLRNSLKNALARIDTLTRLLAEKQQSSTDTLIKTYRVQPMTDMEYHDERLAFAAKCDGEGDGEAIQDQADSRDDFWNGELDPSVDLLDGEE